MTKKESDTLRVNMMWKGQELANLRECKELLRLNDEAGAVRYLVNRGIEAMSSRLDQKRMLEKVALQLTPQQLLPIFEQMAGAAQLKP